MLQLPRAKKSHVFTPLRYPGGKTSFAEFFDRLLKMNGLRRINYVEPFAGGAGAALSLLMMEKVDSIVINDLDRAIYCFWTSILFAADRFIDRIMSTPVTMDEWRIQSEVVRNPESSEFELGFATFFLNRTNHSGILNAGPIGGVNQNGRWLIDARFNKENLARRIRLISMYRDRIAVSNRDALEVITDFARLDDSFLYVDPPYYLKGSSLYLNAYKHDDHVRLAELLNSLRGVNWVLSYDNVDPIRQLYIDQRQQFEISIHYQARTSRYGSELVVVSEALSLPLELFN